MSSPWASPPRELVRDIILHILYTEPYWSAFLPPLRLVCRGWWEAVDAHLPVLAPLEGVPSDTLTSSLHRFPALRALRLDSLGAWSAQAVSAQEVFAALSAVPAACPQLRSLWMSWGDRVQGPPLTVTAAQVSQWLSQLSQLPQLQSLQCYLSMQAPLLGAAWLYLSLTSLTSLSLFGGQGSAASTWGQLGRQLPLLQSLGVLDYRSSRDDAAALGQLLADAASLRYLTLQRREFQSNDNSLLPAPAFSKLHSLQLGAPAMQLQPWAKLTCLASLTSLGLLYSGRPHEGAMQHAFVIACRHLTGLQELSVYGRHVPDSKLRAVSGLAASLTSLTLQHANHLGEAAAQSVAHLSGLRRLVLTGAYLQRGQLEALSGLSVLTYIALEQIHGLDPEDVADTLCMLPALRHAAVLGSPRLRTAHLARVLHGCPRLQLLQTDQDPEATEEGEELAEQQQFRLQHSMPEWMLNDQQFAYFDFAELLGST